MKMKVINIQVALYTYDEDDNMVALDNETCEEIYTEIYNRGEVNGYCITRCSLEETDVDFMEDQDF